MAAGREVVVRIWLSAADLAAVALRIDEMNSYLTQNGCTSQWDEDRELSAILMTGISEIRGRQQREAERTRELNEIDPLLTSHDFNPFPVTEVPAWLKELGASEESALKTRCNQCRGVIDVTNRISGDTVLCACGARLTVRHQARIVGDK